ncbi:MAG TPA: hypothetical protein VEI97_06955, partial [bacterium]|nr:hypothetical protein [bacterium]
KTVAKMLKRAEATIRTWEEVYQDLIIQAAREIASPQDALVPMIPKALRVIQDRLTEPTDNAADRGIQLAAAHDVLDRSWGKAVQRSIVDSRQSIHVSFAPPVGTEIIDSGPAADSAADD